MTFHSFEKRVLMLKLLLAAEGFDESGNAIGPIVDGDAVVTYNFRADRMVMLAKALEVGVKAFTLDIVLAGVAYHMEWAMSELLRNPAQPSSPPTPRSSTASWGAVAGSRGRTWPTSPTSSLSPSPSSSSPALLLQPDVVASPYFAPPRRLALLRSTPPPRLASSIIAASPLILQPPPRPPAQRRRLSLLRSAPWPRLVSSSAAASPLVLQPRPRPPQALSTAARRLEVGQEVRREWRGVAGRWILPSMAAPSAGFEGSEGARARIWRGNVRVMAVGFSRAQLVILGREVVVTDIWVIGGGI
ncbi:hypothetical protein PR202_gb02999 [Eleusine coracana subsp. coracana]|uniref:Phosphoglycerate mutase (2,3-diphosphoglycerate-independent) n=1 Tax=Eleusine coracana subsp. coracana TaxID=191504 RepID=A0AAV5DYB2_ELECO|nr:hypothetical protein PR202_gb02999 [Eleusine coracana subsp. coracana]